MKGAQAASEPTDYFTPSQFQQLVDARWMPCLVYHCGYVRRYLEACALQRGAFWGIS
jgi:hypothetical protein